MLNAIHQAFHDERAASNRWLHLVIGVLVVLSIGLVVVEINLAEDDPALSWVRIADRSLLLFFVVELFVRVASFRPPDLALFNYRVDRRLRVQLLGRLRFCTSPMILIDIATVVALFPALRGLRVLRLLRLLQVNEFFRPARPWRDFAGPFF
jgi:hypothetical protein